MAMKATFLGGRVLTKSHVKMKYVLRGEKINIKAALYDLIENAFCC